MKSEEFIDLNRELGLQIITTASTSWIIRQDRTALSFPTLASMFPSRAEINQIFQYGVKYLAFKTEMSETNCCEYLFQGDNYQLEGFERKVRNRVKKGLESCVIKDAALDDLLVEGLLINQQTMGRQARDEQMMTSQEFWDKYITKLYYARDVYCKGAYVDDKLIGYAIFIKVEDKYYIYHPFMKREYSSYCPINAIYYTFFNSVIENEGGIKISAGLSSFIENDDLVRFKKNMRLEEVSCSRVVVISAKIAPLVNPLGSLILRKAVKMKLASPEFLAKYDILLANKKIYESYLRERAVDSFSGTTSPPQS